MNNYSSEKKHVVRMKRTFNAPRARVFSAWTDPEELKKWFSPSPDHQVSAADVDLRVGGKYRIEVRDRAGAAYAVSGTFKEIFPPEKLSFTWSWDGLNDEGESIVTVNMEDRGDTTDVFLVHELISSKLKSEYEWGWAGAFDKLSQSMSSRFGEADDADAEV